MTTLILGFVLASLNGLVFYLFFGHGWLRLAFYWLVSLIGFAVGHWLAELVGLSLSNIGALNVAEGMIGSWIFLFAARAWRK